VPDVEEILRNAKSLDPPDRLRLITRLWASLPQETWPKPTRNEEVEADRLLTQSGADEHENVSWQTVEQIVRDCVRSSRPKVYSAPRRFDLLTIFVVTTAYALLFASLAALQLPPSVNLMVAGFIATVGIGQAFLFRGLRPRTSSLLVGIAIYCIFIVGNYVLNPRIYPSSMLAYMLFSGLTAGAILGYVAGTLVGGVFLIVDFVRRRLSRIPPTPTAIGHVDESPLSGS
jgi:hypothetical protein